MGLITDIFLPLSLAFIMLSLGLGLTGDDFLRIVKQPKDFFIGALSQIIILPIVAFLLVSVWSIAPELAVGVMIIAAAPGGATSNILTSFAKGDVALSISLTAVISLLCVITIPIIILVSLYLFMGTSITQEFSLTGIAAKMFLIVTVPVILGMLFRKFISNIALSFEPIAKRISTVLFVLVLVGAVISERENIISYFSQAGLITLLLNILMMAIAFFLAQFFSTGEKQKKCITIECGLQNGTLAIVVATSIFGGGMYVIPAATYSLIMFATSLIFIFFIRKNSLN
jgi:BASS family bile acid:Na+ symporter